MAVKCQADETVVFSWTVCALERDPHGRDEKDDERPRMQAADMPFGGERLIYGGFKMISDA